MSLAFAENTPPQASKRPVAYLPAEIRRNARAVRLEQIKLLTQGEAVEFLLAEIEELECKLLAGLPLREKFYHKLTKAESEILDLLLYHRGKVVLKATFYDLLYQLRPDTEQPAEKIIDVFICKLRQKLRANSGPEIHTSWGQGYYIEAKSEQEIFNGPL